jgi:hypothetical protein
MLLFLDCLLRLFLASKINVKLLVPGMYKLLTCTCSNALSFSSSTERGLTRATSLLSSNIKQSLSYLAEYLKNDGTYLLTLCVDLLSALSTLRFASR